jgi:hypothetical protein
VTTARRIAERLAEARAAYDGLVAELRTGAQVSPKVIFGVLRDARLTADHLIVDVFGKPHPEIRPGDDCPRCKAKGSIRVSTSRPQRTTGLVIRRLACGVCGAKVGKQAVPAATVRKRRRCSS